MVVAEGRSLLEAWKPARIRDDGSYEIVLDEPGDVLVSYQDRAFQGGGTEFFVRVPEGESHRFDLELPTGRIEGVVLGPDGAPLDGVRVELERESGLRGVTMMGGQRGETTADGGRFAFTRVTPASYTLRAGGGAFGGDGYGTSLLSGVEVAPGGAALGLRIRLERPGVLRGRVLDSAGQPVAGASVFVRDAGGRLLSGFSTTATDGEGRFRRGNLAPGEVTVSARLGEEASREIGPLRIREGDETEVELSLEPGTVLRVAIEDGEGQAIRAGISVRDASGREFATLRSMDDMQSLMREGFSTTEQRFGPLPPGEYEVTATTQDGRSERRTLKLTGRAERKLRLRLDG